MESGYSLPLIDCRPFSAYCAGHCAGATSLPATEMPWRMHELPRSTQPVALCGDDASLHTASEFLARKGYRIASQTVWTPKLANNLQVHGQLEAGTNSRQLWQPAPLLRHFVTELMPAHGITPGKGLDIACGSGRDTVYLATQGWQMTGIDCIEAALQRARLLANLNGVSIQTECRDLETGTNPFVQDAAASVDLMCVARYLHRPLFPWLKRLLKPGAIVIYQTFMQGCEHTPLGRPRNPNFLLRPGELAKQFAEADILLDEVETLADGRPVSAFICRWQSHD